MDTYEIKIPANPADSGVLKLCATDDNDRERTLVWVTHDDRQSWALTHLVTGQPTKAYFSWRQVLEAFKDVHAPVDPARAAVRAALASVTAELDAMLERYNAQPDDEKGMASSSLADDVAEIIERLRKEIDE